MNRKFYENRPYHAFLSYRHADSEVVDKLYNWLAKEANLKIWYDTNNLKSSEEIVSSLPSAIEQCRAIILVLSKQAKESGWIKKEYDFAIHQSVEHEDFKIIIINIDNSAVPKFVRTTKYIQLQDGQLVSEKGQEILLGLTYTSANLNLKNSRDIYVCRSWRKSEEDIADFISYEFHKKHFRLIGDSSDQQDYSEERVKSIISSCGGVLVIVPHRGNHSTSKYILKELNFARELNLPIVLFKDKEVDSITLKEEELLISFEETDLEIETDKLITAIEFMQEEYKKPPAPHFVFLGAPFGRGDKLLLKRNLSVKDLIEKITSMPCIIGDDIKKANIQEYIANKVIQAHLIIADISEENINTCIEAGIALGAQKADKLFLLQTGDRKRPPFMFRHLQVRSYQDDLFLIALIHKIVYPYRRRIINYELISQFENSRF